jgi:hypothetical protein
LVFPQRFQGNQQLRQQHLIRQHGHQHGKASEDADLFDQTVFFVGEIGQVLPVFFRYQLQLVFLGR